jgi:hypothetical protein
MPTPQELAALLGQMGGNGAAAATPNPLPLFTGANMGLGTAGAFGGVPGTLGSLGTPAPGLMAQLGGRLAPLATKAGIAKGLGYGLAGSLVSGGIDRAIGGNGNVEQALQGAAMGAGLGAPLGPWGAAVGGIGGAGLGLLGNTVFKKKKVDPAQKASDAMGRVTGWLQSGAAAGLPPETQQSILKQFNLAYQFAEDDAQRKAVEETAKQQIMTAATQNQISPQAKPPTGAELAALQIAYAQAMQPVAQQTRLAGQMGNQMYSQLAGQAADPASAAAYNQMAQIQTQGADKLAAAYQAQATLLPSFNAIQQQQSLANQLAQQQMMQGLYGGGGGTGGGMDLQALLSQAG